MSTTTIILILIGALLYFLFLMYLLAKSFIKLYKREHMGIRHVAQRLQVDFAQYEPVNIYTLKKSSQQTKDIKVTQIEKHFNYTLTAHCDL
ncbi:MAG: hypothetical protein JO072_06040 [Parafilimonas sp.]|nr:hypothetical protein [Parafilimonas sp.]